MEESRLNEIIKQWRLKAENDLAIVKHDIGNEHPVTDVLCFHCQQAAEKYLKLFLIYQGSDYPKAHDIAALLHACAAKDSDFHALMDCSYLTDYAVELRYPDNFLNTHDG